MIYNSSSVLSEFIILMITKKVDSVYSNLIYVDQEKLTKINCFWKLGYYSRKKFKFGWIPPYPTFFVKKKLYDQFGKFDLRLKSAADYKFILRALYKHRVFSEYLKQITVKMRSEGKIASSS